jgi:hypothetical protein
MPLNVTKPRNRDEAADKLTRPNKGSKKPDSEIEDQFRDSGIRRGHDLWTAHVDVEPSPISLSLSMTCPGPRYVDRFACHLVEGALILSQSQIWCFVELAIQPLFIAGCFSLERGAALIGGKHDGSITGPDRCVDGGSYDHGKRRLRSQRDWQTG